MADPESGEHASLGLFGSLRRTLADAIELAHTRLQLLSVEVEARMLNSRLVMLWSAVALFSAALAMLMLTFTILIIFWDTHRLLAAGIITAFFALIAVAATQVVRHRVRTRPRLLAATIEELKHDVAALTRSTDGQ
jgi:uncharacterized membrane protein YqjE